MKLRLTEEAHAARQSAPFPGEIDTASVQDPRERLSAFLRNIWKVWPELGVMARCSRRSGRLWRRWFDIALWFENWPCGVVEPFLITAFWAAV